MGDIKRYEPVVEYHELDRGYPSAKMSKDPDGDYVLYTDHQAALAEAQERVKKLEGRVCNLDSCTLRKRLEAENAALHKERDEAREAVDLMIDFIPEGWEVPLGWSQVVAQAKQAIGRKP